MPDPARRRTLVKLAGSGLAASVAGCTGGVVDDAMPGEASNQQGSDDEALLIGLLADFSSELGWVAPNVQNGIQAGIIQTNNNGGIHGRNVTTITYDEGNEPKRAISGFQTLVSQGVVGIIGLESTTLPPLFDRIQQTEVPVVTPLAGTTYLDSRGGEWVYRTTTSDSFLTRPQALFARERGWETLGLAYVDRSGAESFATILKSFYEDRGWGEVIEEVPLDPNATSYRSEINRLVGADPDAVHVTAGQSAGAVFLKNWYELGVDIPLMGGNELSSPGLVEQLGAEAVEGLYAVDPIPSGDADKFVDVYREYNNGEKPGLFAAPAYDAYNLMALALQKAESASRSAVKENITSVSNPPGTQVYGFPEGKAELQAGNEINYQGAATNANLDGTGDVLGGAGITQARDGEFVVVENYTADELSGL